MNDKCFRCGIYPAGVTHVCPTPEAQQPAVNLRVGTVHGGPETAQWRPLQPWTLRERYGDYRVGFWLLFANGDERLNVQVPKETWDAFGK